MLFCLQIQFNAASPICHPFTPYPVQVRDTRLQTQRFRVYILHEFRQDLQDYVAFHPIILLTHYKIVYTSITNCICKLEVYDET